MLKKKNFIYRVTYLFELIILFTNVYSKVHQFSVVFPVNRNTTKVGLKINNKIVDLDDTDYPIWRGEYELDKKETYSYVSYSITDKNKIIKEENFKRLAQPSNMNSNQPLNEFFNRNDSIYNHPDLSTVVGNQITRNQNKYSELFSDNFISTIYLNGDISGYKDLENAHYTNSQNSPSLKVSATIITPYAVGKFENLLLEINALADNINTDIYFTTYYSNKYYFQKNHNPKKTSYFLSYKEYSLTQPQTSPTDKLYYNLFNKTSIQLVSTSSDNLMLRHNTDICNVMDVPSAQVGFTRVYFNNNPIGFYLIKENPNIDYFKNEFNTTEMYGQMNSHFSPMKYNGEFDLIETFPKLLINENIDSYANYWYQGIESPETFHSKNDLAKLFYMTENFNSLDQLKKNFNYDSFLKIMTIDYILNNQHGYLYNGTNYFLYYDKTKNQWNYHEGYFSSPLNDWSKNYIYTEFEEFRFIGKGKQDTRRPIFDNLMNYSSEKHNTRDYINYIVNNFFGTTLFLDRMDSIFNMVHADLKWDGSLEPILDKNNNQINKMSNIEKDYASLKIFIKKRRDEIIKSNRNINLFSIYSIFTNAFLISFIIIFIHLLYGVFINPFVWYFFSNKKTRLFPFTFFKLWLVALFELVIMIIISYFLIGSNLKFSYYKVLCRKIYNYIINNYATFSIPFITFNIICWLLLNRESFMILLGAPFVKWPSLNKKSLAIYNEMDSSSTIINDEEDDGFTLYSDTYDNSSASNNTIIFNNNSDSANNYSTHDRDSNGDKGINYNKHNSTDTNNSFININLGNDGIPNEEIGNVIEIDIVHGNKNKQSKIVSMYKSINHAFLIVCHNSSDVLPATLENLLKITTPMSIFIAENGSSPSEKQKMKEIVDRYSHHFRCTHPNYCGLNIIYANLNEGSKTLAQFCLINNLFWSGIDIKYISIIDDDVLIPENWVEEEILSYFKKDQNVKALAYPIIASNRREGIVSAFQNLEYIISMYSKKVHKDIGTVVFPSGAMSTWSTPFLLECLYRHDTVFRGDDLQLGLRLHTMYGKPQFCDPNELHDGNYKIEIAHVIIDTLVPRCYFHLKEYLPHFLGENMKDCDCGQYSLSRQRVAYWEPARHRFLFKFLYCLLHKCRWNHRATLTAKLFCFDFIISILNDYAFLVLLVFMFLMHSYLPALMIVCICIAISLISLDIFNLIIARNNPKIKLPFEVCVVFPIFYQILSTNFCRIATIIYTLSYYLPFVRTNDSIKERALKRDISNMTIPDIITIPDSEKAIANVSEVTEFLAFKKKMKYQNRKIQIFKKYKPTKENETKEE
ncbi:hypothetical protein BCR36DRAFT_347596 [Piromyces finnis]|uniref:Uncharacterized protein n=1 Tax=Piromyces finnis TaxID=1754191 RepID=A0A1Y1VGU2_9FUNG|nr:hypothetical protein BCR36DRAFT_347596 [Piromyces finnis]|eukprot:ORX54680.1 hypothetical protein BCR36DRAFT_347596 [Piromyces finnis]